ncbi:MAG: hypothetical protein RKP20_04660 [Candidatus Competibacter sp.]|nr:hypothetical protein [Candidatus Competibacter sp.]MDS4069442.1 hypothetical protein [Candidatus Competibacter sp.]
MSLLVMQAGLAGIDAPRPRNWTEAVAGLLPMAQAGSAFALAPSAGVLIGLGLSGATFPVVFGATGRCHRSGGPWPWALRPQSVRWGNS